MTPIPSHNKLHQSLDQIPGYYSKRPGPPHYKKNRVLKNSPTHLAIFGLHCECPYDFRSPLEVIGVACTSLALSTPISGNRLCVVN